MIVNHTYTEHKTDHYKLLTINQFTFDINILNNITKILVKILFKILYIIILIKILLIQ